MKTKIEKILDIATLEDVKEMFYEINAYDGYMQDMYCYLMDDFDELHYNAKPWEIARAITYGNFNASDDLWRYNAYGNLESLSEWDYDREIEEYQDEIVEHFVELYMDGDVSCYNSEIEEILDNEAYDLIDEWEEILDKGDYNDESIERENEIVNEIEELMTFEDEEDHNQFIDYLMGWTNWEELKEMILERL